MTYSTMKKLIANANAQLQAGLWTEAQYMDYKVSQQNKIDMFYAKNRLSDAQYEELTGMWLETNDDKAS